MQDQDQQDYQQKDTRDQIDQYQQGSKEKYERVNHMDQKIENLTQGQDQQFQENLDKQNQNQNQENIDQQVQDQTNQQKQTQHDKPDRIRCEKCDLVIIQQEKKQHYLNHQQEIQKLHQKQQLNNQNNPNVEEEKRHFVPQNTQNLNKNQLQQQSTKTQQQQRQEQDLQMTMIEQVPQRTFQPTNQNQNQQQGNLNISQGFQTPQSTQMALVSNLQSQTIQNQNVPPNQQSDQQPMQIEGQQQGLNQTQVQQNNQQNQNQELEIISQWCEYCQCYIQTEMFQQHSDYHVIEQRQLAQVQLQYQQFMQELINMRRDIRQSRAFNQVILGPITIDQVLGDNERFAVGQGMTEEEINQKTKLKQFSLRESNPICPICVTMFEGDELIRELPCLHCFHQQCIDNWLVRKENCPLCKRSLK